MTTQIQKMQRMTWEAWLWGLVDAALSATANAVGLMIVDPHDFNPFGSGDWHKLAAFAGASAFIAIALYVKTHKVPPVANEDEP